jgi:hypothetical protein
MAENPTTGKPVACMRRQVSAACGGRLAERAVDHPRDLAQLDMKDGVDRLRYIWLWRADHGGTTFVPRRSLAVRVGSLQLRSRRTLCPPRPAGHRGSNARPSVARGLRASRFSERYTARLRGNGRAQMRWHNAVLARR